VTFYFYTRMEQVSENCSYCEAKFTHRNNLHDHIYYEHTEPRDPRFICDLCIYDDPRGIVFESKKEFKKHIRYYHICLCPSCHSEFGRNHNFMRHTTEVCTTAMKNECKICAKTFDTFKHLQGHAWLMHKINKMYCCSKCICTFRIKEDLGKHFIKFHSVA